MLKVTGRRCLVIGGGRVGARRAKMLVDAGAAVTVIAPEVHEDLLGLPVEVRRRSVEPADIDDWYLIVVATPDESVNAMVSARAGERSFLVNRADDPASSDLDFMAVHREGPLTFAVHTSGVSATAAAAIRTQLAAKLDHHWPRMLEIAAPYRERIQQAFPDSDDRTAHLRRLTDAHAIAILRDSGEAAFRTYCETLATP